MKYLGTSYYIFVMTLLYNKTQMIVPKAQQCEWKALSNKTWMIVPKAQQYSWTLTNKTHMIVQRMCYGKNGQLTISVLW